MEPLQTFFQHNDGRRIYFYLHTYLFFAWATRMSLIVIDSQGCYGLIEL